MKRIAVDDAESRARIKRRQMLLQDYSELEKKIIMKKQRYKLLKQKRATLMAELRFLRRRYQLLSENQAANKETDKSPKLTPTIISRVPESSQVQESEPPLIGKTKTYLATDLHPILASVLEEGRNLQALPVSSLPPTKKAKTCSINETGTKKKKKVLWKTQEPVKV